MSNVQNTVVDSESKDDCSVNSFSSAVSISRKSADEESTYVPNDMDAAESNQWKTADDSEPKEDCSMHSFSSGVSISRKSVDEETAFTTNEKISEASNRWKTTDDSEPKEDCSLRSFSSGVSISRKSVTDETAFGTNDKNSDAFPQSRPTATSITNTVRARIAQYEQLAKVQAVDEKIKQANSDIDMASGSNIDRTTTVDSVEHEKSLGLETSDSSEESLLVAKPSVHFEIAPTSNVDGKIVLTTKPEDNFVAPQVGKERAQHVHENLNETQNQYFRENVDDIEILRLSCSSSRSFEASAFMGRVIGRTTDQTMKSSDESFDIVMSQAQDSKPLKNDLDCESQITASAPVVSSADIDTADPQVITATQALSNAVTNDLTASMKSTNPIPTAPADWTSAQLEEPMISATEEQKQSSTDLTLHAAASRVASIPACVEIQTGRKDHSSEDRSCLSTVGLSAFEKMRAPTVDSRESPEESVKGGRMWEQAASSPTSAPKEGWIVHTTGSIADDSCGLTESTVGGSYVGQEHEKRGRMWEPIPAITPSHSKEMINAIHILQPPRESHQSLNDGEQLLQLAAASSNPNLKSLTPQKDDIISVLQVRSLADDSCDLTESTGPNEFDAAMSCAIGYEQINSEESDGGRSSKAGDDFIDKERLDETRSAMAPQTSKNTMDEITSSLINESAGQQMLDVAGGQRDHSYEAEYASPNIPSTGRNEMSTAPSHSSVDTIPTLGAGAFEKLRAPTPDSQKSASFSRTYATTQIAQALREHDRLSDQPKVPNSGARSESPYTPEALVVLSESRLTSNSQDELGGVLWTLASENEFSSVPKTSVSDQDQFARALIEQTRSRAEPNAVPDDFPRKMVNPRNDAEMEGDIYPVKEKNSNMDLPNRKMVQLLVTGCFVTLLGWLGNFFVTDSCYFAAVPVAIGQYQVNFDMHYGLWKYSSPESALLGFPYCKHYEEDAPIIARVFHLLSLAVGSFGLAVLWCYLFTGCKSAILWNAAVWMSPLAAIFQLLTLLFFQSKTCREEVCRWGLGSSIVLVTAFAWVVLGLELRYQTPFVLRTDADDDNTISDNESTTNGKISAVNWVRVESKKKERREQEQLGDYQPPTFCV